MANLQHTSSSNLEPEGLSEVLLVSVVLPVPSVAGWLSVEQAPVQFLTHQC